MVKLIEDAKSKGAEVIFGGNSVKRPGFFLQPTVLANVTGMCSHFTQKFYH